MRPLADDVLRVLEAMSWNVHSRCTTATTITEAAHD